MEGGLSVPQPTVALCPVCHPSSSGTPSRLCQRPHSTRSLRTCALTPDEGRRKVQPLTTQTPLTVYTPRQPSCCFTIHFSARVYYNQDCEHALWFNSRQTRGQREDSRIYSPELSQKSNGKHFGLFFLSYHTGGWQML